MYYCVGVNKSRNNFSVLDTKDNTVQTISQQDAVAISNRGIEIKGLVFGNSGLIYNTAEITKNFKDLMISQAVKVNLGVQIKTSNLESLKKYLEVFFECAGNKVSDVKYLGSNSGNIFSLEFSFYNYYVIKSGIRALEYTEEELVKNFKEVLSHFLIEQEVNPDWVSVMVVK